MDELCEIKTMIEKILDDKKILKKVYEEVSWKADWAAGDEEKTKRAVRYLYYYLRGILVGKGIEV